MKKDKIKFGFIILFLLGMMSCEEFLEENPKNFISPDNFYRNTSDVQSALAGVYANYNMQIWSNRYMYWITKMNTDDNEVSAPWTLSEPGFIDNSADNGDLAGLWDRSYEGIKRANDFISRVTELGENIISADLKNRMLGEAKFLRALHYYFLVSSFGDVPLVTEPYDPGESPLVEKEDVTTVIDFFIGDLMDAVNALPPKSEYSGMDVSRINRDAAKMLIAKFAMRKNDWTQAKQYIDEIIASGEFELEEDVAMNWDLATEHGKEAIYEINFAADMVPRLGNIFHNHTAPPSARNPLTGDPIGGGKWGGALYNQLFYDSFHEDDQRKWKLFWPTEFYEEDADGRYYTTKYWDFETMDRARGGQGPVNLPYFRYADLLLMKAEVENEINQGPNTAAYDAINQVRNRANVPDLDPGLSYDEFLNKVFDERDFELFYEGHHWFELNRRSFEFVESRVEPSRLEFFELVNFDGKFDFQEHMMLWPIPQGQLDANPKLVQNPGF